jgi:membrane-associated phospholipid phosphatase
MFILVAAPAGARTAELHNPLAEPEGAILDVGWQPTTVAMLWEDTESDSAVTRPAPILARESRPLVTRSELRWFLLGTALLAATDRRTVHWLDADLNEAGPAGDEEGRTVSRLGTGLPIAVAVALPAALDGRYGRRTSTLAVMALVNATLATEGLKFVTGKERPWQSGGALRFHGPGSGYHSFPSGHTTAAFAVATVIGDRYRKYRVPLYLLAAAIGWARVNAARHFPSDVFVGAGIGVYSGRYVLRHGARLWSLRF